MKKKNKIKVIYKSYEYYNEFKVIANFGIFSIVFLEALALMKGINGTMFGAAIAGIAGIIGWSARAHIEKIRRHKKRRKK